MELLFLFIAACLGVYLGVVLGLALVLLMFTSIGYVISFFKAIVKLCLQKN